jgi:hypothetical protein
MGVGYQASKLPTLEGNVQFEVLTAMKIHAADGFLRRVLMW